MTTIVLPNSPGKVLKLTAETGISRSHKSSRKPICNWTRGVSATVCVGHLVVTPSASSYFVDIVNVHFHSALIEHNGRGGHVRTSIISPLTDACVVRHRFEISTRDASLAKRNVASRYLFYVT